MNERKASTNSINSKTSDGIIYPNPAKDQIFYSTQITERGIFKISDVLGNPITSFIIKNGRLVINTTEYTPGIYYFNVNFDEGTKQSGWFSVIK